MNLKQTVLIFLSLLLISCSKELTSIKPQNDDFTIWDYPETGPTFPGGMGAFYKLIDRNQKYPQEAIDKEIEGKVYVQFTVDIDGTLKDIKVVRDIGGGCGDESIRLMKLSPKWKPATHQGTPIPQRLVLPISFKMGNDY